MSAARITMPWKRGAVPHAATTPFVSATRTEILRLRDLPGIVLGGLRLRAGWAKNPGSIGMKISLDLRQRVSWSLSAWETEADLERFVRSQHHRRVVAPYRQHVKVRATRWQLKDFSVRDAWSEARARLAPEPPRVR
jgi:hypothetical protein